MESHKREKDLFLLEIELDKLFPGQKQNTLKTQTSTSSRSPALRWQIPISPRRRLKQVGLAEPAVLITADDVRRGKPEPEGMLLAAQALGVDPSKCLVIEDAAAGIAAIIIGAAAVTPNFSSSAFTNDASEYLGGGFVKCWLGMRLKRSSFSPTLSAGSLFLIFPSSSSSTSPYNVMNPSKTTFVSDDLKI